MSVPLAYLGVILVWTTTPLAIKWSGEGPGFLFGVTARMTISVLLALTLVRLARIPFRLDREARRAYFAAGVGIYGAMLCTYWGAQFIPSGWISVLFGMSPIITGVMAAVWLGGCTLTPMRMIGMLLGLIGLSVIFGRGLALEAAAAQGVVAVAIATLFHSGSAVWVQRLGAGIPALAMVAGGLSVATPLYWATWAIFDGGWPEALPVRAGASIIYLAIFGSVMGFAFYYYVLRHVEATRVALITLVTPVSALLLGHGFNGEPLTVQIWLGTGLVVSGLAAFELGDRLFRRAKEETETSKPRGARGARGSI